MKSKDKWKIEYDNDTGPDDEGYWEWWIVTDGETVFRACIEVDAIWLCQLLNKSGMFADRPHIA